MIVYRGALDRSKLLFLTSAWNKAFGPSDLVWLVPKPEWRTDHRLTFLRALDAVRTVHALDGRWAALPRAARAAEDLGAGAEEPVAAIGFSALPFAQRLSAGPLTWFVNGIPEERLLHGASPIARASVAATWRLGRRGRAPMLVVPSSPAMADLIEQRRGYAPSFPVPSCVDAPAFAPPATADRRWVTYLGTGAPWQAIDRTAAVWRAMHAARPDLRFRVISRDPRTARLIAGIAPDVTERRSAHEPAEIAALLHEATAGFLLRDDHVVNRVSFPIKFGEYLAAGVLPVLTDIAWWPGRIAAERGAGLMVDPDLDAAATATAVIAALDARAADPRGAEAACVEAAQAVDRDRWVRDLADALTRTEETAATREGR